MPTINTHDSATSRATELPKSLDNGHGSQVPARAPIVSTSRGYTSGPIKSNRFSPQNHCHVPLSTIREILNHLSTIHRCAMDNDTETFEINNWATDTPNKPLPSSHPSILLQEAEWRDNERTWSGRMMSTPRPSEAVSKLVHQMAQQMIKEYTHQLSKNAESMQLLKQIGILCMETWPIEGGLGWTSMATEADDPKPLGFW